MKESLITRRFKENYRLLENYQAGKNFFEIRFVKNRKSVDAWRELEEVRIHHIFNWVADNARFFIKLTRQHSLPMVIDGIMNLYSKYLTRKDKVKVYEASWVRQAAGTQVEVRKGIIAKFNSVTFHLEVDGRVYEKHILKAVAGVYRKSEKTKLYLKALREERNRQEQNRSSFMSHIPADLVLTLNLARKAGHCLLGIERFCNHMGLDMHSKYNARDVWFKFTQSKWKNYEHDLKLVILYAIRNSRQKKKKKSWFKKAA